MLYCQSEPSVDAGHAHRRRRGVKSSSSEYRTVVGTSLIGTGSLYPIGTVPYEVACTMSPGSPLSLSVSPSSKLSSRHGLPLESAGYLPRYFVERLLRAGSIS